MADMIIKPSDGNSLVIQDEGGDAALTVGTTGNTTLAGTANALGTINPTGTTFPAGHVIQTRVTVLSPPVGGSSNQTVTITYAQVNLNGNLEITGFTATNGNKLIITAGGFTMGSGSCGVSCKLTGRSFIGVELEKEYYDIAVSRIDSVGPIAESSVTPNEHQLTTQISKDMKTLPTTKIK